MLVNGLFEGFNDGFLAQFYANEKSDETRKDETGDDAFSHRLGCSHHVTLVRVRCEGVRR